MFENNFSENLKSYRLKKDFTQKELAEKIKISEKSVSKWETGNGLPGIELIVELSKVFNVRLEDLLFGRAENQLYLGIDGGGTKTVFLLTDRDEKIINRVEKGAVNPIDIGMEQAKEILKQGINEVCFGYSYDNILMFAGLAGGATGNNDDIFKAFFSQFGFRRFKNGCDIENIIELGLNHCDGIVVIMGTGVIAYGVKNGQYKRIGGWGKLFDDGGSGYNFGRDAISAVLKSKEGRIEKTVMEQLIENRLEKSLISCIPDIYSRGMQYIASFSNIVFEAWEQGDCMAEEIIDRNMKEVATLIDACGRFVDNEMIPVKLVGGLTNKDTVLYPYIKKHLQSDKYNLETILTEPVFGAIRLAKKENLL